jgi:ribosome-binding protein aMBF1 (putative translation factor)
MKKINNKKWISAEEAHRKWMKNPEYRREYEKLETEFQIAEQVIKARVKKNLTQQELAKKVGTGQAVISRLEGRNSKSSISLLERVAKALGTKINLTIG